jgi:hypothetical protein
MTGRTLRQCHSPTTPAPVGLYFTGFQVTARPRVYEVALDLHPGDIPESSYRVGVGHPKFSKGEVALAEQAPPRPP